MHKFMLHPLIYLPIHTVLSSFILARAIWETEPSTEKITLPDWPVGKPVGHFLNW